MLLLLAGASSLLHFSPAKRAQLRSTSRAFAPGAQETHKLPIDDDEFVDYVIGKFFTETMKWSVSGREIPSTTSNPWLLVPVSCQAKEKLGLRITELMLPHLKEAFADSDHLSGMFGVSSDLSFDTPSPELDSLKSAIAEYMMSGALSSCIDHPEGLSAIIDLLD
jgi:hypothetical protein